MDVFAGGVAISVPIAMAGVAMPPALCALLGTGAMALVGLVMFFVGVRGWRRAGKFGAATLVLARVPVPHNGAVDGTLELSFAPASDFRARDGGVRVPVRYELPNGLPPTRPPAPFTLGGTPRHEWTLTCDIEAPGVDFASSFEIPVFPG